MKKLIQLLAVAAVLVAPTFFTGSASALTTTQFSLTSDPATAVVDFSHVTTPPLPGQPITISENLKDSNGQLAGSAHIACTILLFTTTDLLLDCNATFTLTGGTITGHATFLTSQHNYTAFVLSGTGAYKNVIGTVQVLDRAPGDETYNFNLVQL